MLVLMTMKRQSKSPVRRVSRKPVRSPDVPVTVVMMEHMEGRLTHRMDAGFKRVDSQFGRFKVEMDTIKADVKELQADVKVLQKDVKILKADVKILKADVAHLKTDVSCLRTEFKADFHEIKSELHRVALLVEEQNACNKFVMDGYAQIYEWIRARSPEV